MGMAPFSEQSEMEKGATQKCNQKNKLKIKRALIFKAN